MGVHDGHRDRLREQYLEHGIASFSDITALELLLFYAIPRRNTNEFAHALIERFDSLDGVLSASVTELEAVPGIGRNAAVLISLLRQLSKKAQVSMTGEIKQVLNSTAAGDYLIPRFMYENDEILLMLCLDTQRRIICCKEMSRGTVNTVEANVRRVVETALKYRASSVIISHNHPDGIALPSREDDYVTKEIYKSLKLVNIELLDHIIVADEDYVSMADSGIFSLYKFE